LSRQKFHALASPAFLRELRRGPVNYAKVKALKRSLLQAAFESFVRRHFDRGTTRAAHFRAFLTENAHWLPDYALFRMLVEENGGSAVWEQWPAEHQTLPQARAWLFSLPEKQQAELSRKQLYFMYAQWLAFTQWQGLKSYGDSRKVWLMGDIPFGVSRHSADVWANRELFDMEWSGGAPPEKFFKVDAFTEQWGQNWGIANYCWDEMRRRDFNWWRTRVDNIRKIFRFSRIDHAPGFFRIYSFPWRPDRNSEFAGLTDAQAAARTGGRLPGFRPFPDDTVEHKMANQQRGEEILRVVLEAAGDTVIVAEDLGFVPEYVPPTLHKLGIPGCRIPPFSREPDGRYTDAALYPRLSLTQPASHDHAPLAAAWAEHWQEIDADRNVENHLAELRRWMDFAGIDEEEAPREFTGRLREAYLRAVLRSNSWLVIVMITDVLGQVVRFNTPGSLSAENWSARLACTVKDLGKDPELAARGRVFARLAREAGRRA
jgi:4-alpha-glucanotransferase